MKLLEKLKEFERRYEELSTRLADPSVLSDLPTYQQLAKVHAELSSIVDSYRRYQRLLSDIEQTQALLNEGGEAELKELVEAELKGLAERREALERELELLLLPKDPNDEKDIILEIRAGAGGEEAALFAAELARMYSRYADGQGWKVEILSSHLTGIGGFKEIILGIQGKGVYGKLRFERGVHRVQRVPVTEASGRIHTSTVTVAVLPEAQEVEVEIDPKDLKVEVFRASGHGGQHVNVTDSAVRITHLPTGIVVSCQDERSQHKNRAKAMRVLRARLFERAKAEQEAEISQQRREQVGTGDRSEKIRTYNFPQWRITDHRIGLSLYRLEDVLAGDLDELIGGLVAHHQVERLKAVA
ncbi:MAG: peptide chain release factor 1 [candidate division NC10 bacterium]|nr:peptide chain release factor 1 [candidate division NC10 bacterium]